MVRSILTVFLLLFFWKAAHAVCPDCESDDSLFIKLPPSCINEVKLVIENSNTYGPADLKNILPFIRKANKHFYKCENYDIAVGNNITVIVDRDQGIIYMTRYIYQPEER